MILKVKNVAALFVQPQGCYSNLPNVEMWDEVRDARKYDGNLPVIAHPPCQRWGLFAEINYKQWKFLPHLKPGNDFGCFESALKSVMRCGGVIEHPANSLAFPFYGLGKPRGKREWQRSGGGWICEVWQSAYGHRANKATWLFFTGGYKPFQLLWNRPEGTHKVGRYTKGSFSKPSLKQNEANATPLAFRDELIKLALWSVDPMNDFHFS